MLGGMRCGRESRLVCVCLEGRGAGKFCFGRRGFKGVLGEGRGEIRERIRRRMKPDPKPKTEQEYNIP